MFEYMQVHTKSRAIPAICNTQQNIITSEAKRLTTDINLFLAQKNSD